MARIAGITAERTASGRATVIKHLDIRKFEHSVYLPLFFKEIGFEVESYELNDVSKASLREVSGKKKLKRYKTVESLIAALNS